MSHCGSQKMDPIEASNGSWEMETEKKKEKNNSADPHGCVALTKSVLVAVNGSNNFADPC